VTHSKKMLASDLQRIAEELRSATEALDELELVAPPDALYAIRVARTRDHVAAARRTTARVLSELAREEAHDTAHAA
jgi:hypothetical protein